MEENYQDYQKRMDENKRLFSGFLVSIAYLFVLASIIYSVIFGFVSNVTIETNSIAAAAAEVVSGVISIYLIYRIFKDRIGEFLRGFTLKNAGEGLKYFFIMLLVSLLVFYLDLMIFGESPNTNANEASIDQSLLYSPILMLIYTCIIAPIMEEFIFRFLIYKTIAKKHPILGIIVGGSTFGLIHMFLSLSNFISDSDVALLINDLRTLPSYIGAGIVLCIAYYKTNQLSTSIMAHAFNNIYACGITLFSAVNAPVIVKNIETNDNSISCKITENIDTNLNYTFTIKDSKDNDVVVNYVVNENVYEFTNLEANTVYYINIKYSYEDDSLTSEDKIVEEVIEIYAKTR